MYRSKRWLTAVAWVSVMFLAVATAPALASPGTLDPSFGTGGRTLVPVGAGGASALQANGDVVQVGQSSAGWVVARFLPSGALDSSFDPNGSRAGTMVVPGTVGGYANSVAVDPQGNVVVVGQLASGTAAVMRVGSGGQPDPSFNSGKVEALTLGDQGASSLHGVVLLSSGEIAAVGYASQGAPNHLMFAYVRVSSSGKVDGSTLTDVGSGGDAEAFAAALLPGDQVLAVGRAVNPSPDNSFAAVRYNPDGSVDKTFGTGGESLVSILGSDDEAYGVAVQSDGKYVLAGNSYGKAGAADLELARLSHDGSPDKTFHSGAGPAGTVVQTVGDGSGFLGAVALTSVGGVVAAGGAVVGGRQELGVFSYRSNGTPDQSFLPAGQPSNTMLLALGSGAASAGGVLVSSSGRIIASGSAAGSSGDEFALVGLLGTPPASPATVTDSFDGLAPGTVVHSDAAGFKFPQGPLAIRPAHSAPNSFPLVLRAPRGASYLQVCFPFPATAVQMYAGVNDAPAPAGGTWARLVGYDRHGAQIVSGPDTEIALPGAYSDIDTLLRVSDQAGRISCVRAFVGRGTAAHDTGARTPAVDDLNATMLLPALTAPYVTIDSPADGSSFTAGSTPRDVAGVVSAPNGIQNFCVLAGDATTLPFWSQCSDNRTIPGHSLISSDGHYNVSAPLTHVGTNSFTAWVRDDDNRISTATITITLNQPPPRRYDLSVGAIEVTQAVQPFDLPGFNAGVSGPTPGIGQSYRVGPYTGVTLVRDKTTIVRVYPFSSDPTDIGSMQMDGRVYGYQKVGANWVQLPGSPIMPNQGPINFVPYTGGIQAERADPRDALEFTLPIEWTHHNGIRIAAQIIPPPDSSRLTQRDTSGNVAALDGISFITTQAVTISPLEMDDTVTDHGTTTVFRPPADPVPVFDGLKAILPVGDARFTVQPYMGAIDITNRVGGVFDEDYGLTAALNDFVHGGCAGQANCTIVGCGSTCGQPVGVLPGFCHPVCHSYTVPPPFFSPTMSVVEAPRPYTAVAHEFGHVLGRPHASGSCGGGGFLGIGGGESWPPDDRGYLQGVGTDPQPGDQVSGFDRIYYPGMDGQPHDYDYMSYCNGLPDNGGDNCFDSCSWVSPRGWTELLNSLTGTQGFPRARDRAGSSAGAPVLQVSAMGVPGHPLSIISVMPARGTASRPNSSAVYQLVARSSSGAVLSREAMAATVTHFDQGGGGMVLLSATVPAARVTRLDLLNNGVLAAIRRRSPHPPAVILTFPRKGTRLDGRHPVRVSWHASERGLRTPLQETLLYSTDGGRHYRAIGQTSAGSLLLPAALFASSRHARLRLVVTDGWQVTTVTSPAFTATGAAPVVRILSPRARLRISRYATLVLSGEAASGTTPLTGSHLVWYIGRRRVGTGALVTVSRLPLGRVRITLRARDAAGHVGRASVTITTFTPPRPTRT